MRLLVSILRHLLVTEQVGKVLIFETFESVDEWSLLSKMANACSFRILEGARRTAKLL